MRQRGRRPYRDEGEMNERSREQQLVDLMFELVLRGRFDPEFSALSRDELAAAVSHNLNALGFVGAPVGLCWHCLASGAKVECE